MTRVGGLPEGRRTRLQTATRRLHQDLDALMMEAGFLSSISKYASYLAASYRARAAVEMRLDISGARQIYPVWPRRQIAHLIEEDLTDLGASIPERLAVPAAPPLSKGGVLGALYVLEGSAIGARLIGQRVAAMGMGPEFGARHLAHQATEPKAWPAFLHVLESANLTDEEDRACLHEALATFDRFTDHYMAAA
jgi:heme oxygenase